MVENNFFIYIPDEILDIIFSYIRPSTKYKLNKTYFNKYYYYRFAFVNRKFLCFHKYLSYLSLEHSYIIKNCNYISYLIKYDIKLVLENIINYKLNNDKSQYILTKEIKFQNMQFKNFIDFCYLQSIKYKSTKIYKYLIDINRRYNVISNKEYKSYNTKNKRKNIFKNKNVRWII